LVNGLEDTEDLLEDCGRRWTRSREEELIERKSLNIIITIMEHISSLPSAI